MAAGTIPILICSDPADDSLFLGSPIPSENVFQRIIRNPRPETPHARERECTEMLASVLLNAPILRRSLCRWMAEQSGLTPDLIDRLKIVVETERHVRAKRVDLWIEGHATSEAEGVHSLLWMMEVKVGSAFHQSIAQGHDNGEDSHGKHGRKLDEELVSQLNNYDGWLFKSHATHRQGFVLAYRDLSKELPPNLKCGWTCLSWTGLGLAVRAAMTTQSLPPEENLFAAHLLGFIRKNLWRIEEMPNTDLKLSFDDIALIRAFSRIGRECEKKADALIESIVPLVEEAGVGSGKVTHYKWLYKDSSCSVLCRFLEPRFTKESDPYLEVGIGFDESYGDMVYVWIITPRPSRAEAVRKAVALPLKRLLKRNKHWIEGSGEPEDYGVLGLYLPLTDLLAADDQQAMLAKFVRDALRDLKETEAIRFHR